VHYAINDLPHMAVMMRLACGLRTGVLGLQKSWNENIQACTPQHVLSLHTDACDADMSSVLA
jgi:hypothetical protein